MEGEGGHLVCGENGERDSAGIHSCPEKTDRVEVLGRGKKGESFEKKGGFGGILEPLKVQPWS